MRSRRPWRPVVAAVVLAAGVVTSAVSAVADQGDETLEVGDPESTRRVYLVIVGLLVLAAVLATLTAWYWRSTRPESGALSRLEMMGLRRWGRADYTDRQTQLERARQFVGGEGPLAERIDGSVLVADTDDATLLGADDLGGDDDLAGDDDLVGADDLGGEGTEPALVGAGATLAELVGATPEPPVAPYGGSIGDPEVLRALGLDDESLGLAPVPPVSPIAPTKRSWWSHSDRVPMVATEADRLEADEDDDAEDDGLVAVPAAVSPAATVVAAPRMDPLFDLAEPEPPPVWAPDDEVTDDELHEREATGEFERLVVQGPHHDDPPPEQQRFSLPGEPLL